MKKIIGKFLRKILPSKIYKLVANGWIVVPKYYEALIDDAELYMNLSLEDSIKKDILLLRKYAHIIDKGLHREDAEPGHSNSIYIELKSLVDKISQTDYADDPSYIWAKDRLHNYEILQNDCARFVHLRGDVPPIPPYSYDVLFEIIKQRRSCRDFEEKNLEVLAINKICAAADWASSSCNKQPLKIFITNNPSLAAECLKCCKGGTGFSNFIPSFWVVTANCRGYVWPTEIMLPTLDGSLGLQNMLLIAHTLGISGTILTWAQKSLQDDAKLRKLLLIPEDYIIICCAVMGYPKSYFKVPSRKKPEVSVINHSVI